MFLDHRRPGGSAVAGHRKTLACLESLPVDHVHYRLSKSTIPSRAFPVDLVQQTESGLPSRSAATTRSQSSRAKVLLRKYEECCTMVPKLGRRIGRARAMLDLVENVPVVCSGNSFSVIADKDIQLVRAIWHQLYDRLGLDVPFSRFASSGNCTAAGRRLTFGNCQERCDQGPQLKKRIERCQDAIQLIRLQSLSMDCVLGDNEIAFHQDVWLRIYSRLGLEIPFPGFSNGQADNA
ncbi:unnamed protein product [Penicillium camemberti]|uniref:Str. FM013 n=1 Tax=Penicillium camemberti (strain FM 013) TaxID=1429867 RepID=A0A0G4NZS0_PENC3|nr:unnamed protein product [Penicillium camemberti]